MKNLYVEVSLLKINDIDNTMKSYKRYLNSQGIKEYLNNNNPEFCLYLFQIFCDIYEYTRDKNITYKSFLDMYSLLEKYKKELLSEAYKALQRDVQYVEQYNLYDEYGIDYVYEDTIVMYHCIIVFLENSNNNHHIDNIDNCYFESNSLKLLYQYLL